MSGSLNNIMQFDHVIEVTASGDIVERADLYAPEVSTSGGDLYMSPASEWRLMDGYSGQQGYAGPVMHSSESIGGRLESDIRENAGVYVAVVVSDLESEEIPAGWAVAYRTASTL